MANISIDFTTTAAQDAKLAKALAWVNANLPTPIGGPPPTPYPNVTAWLRDVVIDYARNAIVSSDVREEGDVRSAYTNASEATKDQVKALLGL